MSDKNLHKNLCQLLNSKDPSNQFIALYYLQSQGYISPKLADQFRKQYNQSKGYNFLPNRYIKLVSKEEDIFIHLGDERYIQEAFIQELGFTKNLTKLSVSLSNLNKLLLSLKNADSLEELNIYADTILWNHNLLPSTDWDRILDILENLKTLRKLRIRYANIPFIPKGTNRLQNLRILYLYSNSIKHIPKEIGELENLELLDLGSNGLTEIPKEIANMNGLYLLDLKFNQLKRIPEEILRMKNLHHLDIGKNAIPEWLKRKYQPQKGSNLVIVK